MILFFLNKVVAKDYGRDIGITKLREIEGNVIKSKEQETLDGAEIPLRFLSQKICPSLLFGTLLSLNCVT